ncbi:MAG: ABC-type iron transport system FetAB permease component [Shewanella sp.]|jgi:ABC-type iron transport system FetAB permease component
MTMGSSIDIVWWQLAVFMSVLIIPLAINLKLKLHLGREILVSVTRMICQLILVGLYLEFLFSLDSLWINFSWLSMIVLIGASAIITGAQPYQAAFPFLQSALSQSVAPILASMTSMGLVTLLGMMTGQILGGSDPMLAVKYQLIILVAIFVALSVSVTGSLILSINRCITHTGLVTIRIDIK